MYLLNKLYYYVQRCIASSNNSKLDTKSHLSTEIVFLENARIRLAAYNFNESLLVVVVVVVVVIQFLSGVFPLAEMAVFTPSLSAMARTPSVHLSRLRASSFLKPIFSVSSSTAFSMSFSVVLAFSCHSLQD